MTPARNDRQVAEDSIRDFYAELRAALGPLHFGSLVVAASARVQAGHHDPSFLRVWPSPYLLHSIELASSACSEESGFTVDEPLIQRVLDCYRRFNDPIHEHVLRELQSVELFLMLLDREQLQTQFNANRFTVSRTLRLFWRKDPLPKTSAAIAGRFGFSVEDLVTTAFFGWASTMNRRTPHIPRNYGASIPESILPLRVFEKCIAELAYSRKSLAAWSASSRDMARPLRASSVESPFLRRPGIRLPDGWAVPRPDLMIAAIASTVMELGEAADAVALREELGASLESYLDEVLGAGPGVIRRIPASCIRERSTAVGCDGIYEYKDSILLVEAKAVELSAKLIAPEVLADRRCSTAHLAEGARQVHATAVDVRRGLYDDVLSDSGKPMYGVILTLGHFPQANGEWMQKSVFRPQVGAARERSWPEPLAWTPQVWDTEALDRFVTLMAIEGSTPLAIFEEKRLDAQRTLGEWDRFLSIRTGGKSDPLRKFFRSPFDDFWEARFAPVLGAPPFEEE